LELASIGSSEFLKEIVQRAIPYVDSLGLNEQELCGVYLATEGSDYTVNDFKSPQVITAVDAIKRIFRIKGQKPNLKDTSYLRNLSRVHFHCLHFHLVVQRKASMWEKGTVSVAMGSLATTEQACNFEDVDLLLPPVVDVAKNRNVTVSAENPVTIWRDGTLEFYLAPVLVCRKPTKTVGLGDTISAIGLVYHERKTIGANKDES